MLLEPSVSQRQTQTVVLAPQLRHGLKVLAMGRQELRREMLKEISQNPVVDDEGSSWDEPGESPDDPDARDAENREPGDGAVDDLGVAYLEGANRGTSDPEALDRRERFFSNQEAEESLEEHLLAQVKVSDIPERDFPLVEMLIGELDGDGYFRGSLREIAEVSGESEQKLRALLKRIASFDPPGCGATTLAECLEPQLDSIRDGVMRQRVHALLQRLTDISHVRQADRAVIAALRSLNPRPGSAFSRSRYESEIVRPEVRIILREKGFSVDVDDSGLPTIRISRRYLDLLEDPKVDQSTKDYVRERLASVRGLIDAVERRKETIAAIVRVIFEAQPDFFRGGMDALRPLTMQEVADKVGMHHTTVSRTVRGKYVATPKGTFELRRFFTSGVSTAEGETASVTTVLHRLKELVMGEDVEHPLSDDILSRKLQSFGYIVARRTVSKYRKRLGIPPAAKRAVKPS